MTRGRFKVLLSFLENARFYRNLLVDLFKKKNSQLSALEVLFNLERTIRALTTKFS